VNGVAAGAGLSLVACCDLAISADHARFTSAYTQIGLSPDGSSTYYLTRLLGTRRATELYLTNRVLTAAEALDWGLVNRVVPGAALLDEVGRLAAQFADGPTAAYGGVKRLMLTAAHEGLETRWNASRARSPSSRCRATASKACAPFSTSGRRGFTGE
jgi:2-(1,2-epoxy-1,2-dihydrophenyl)acetyl-CoA isomerase